RTLQSARPRRPRRCGGNAISQTRLGVRQQASLPRALNLGGRISVAAFTCCAKQSPCPLRFCRHIREADEACFQLRSAHLLSYASVKLLTKPYGWSWVDGSPQ